MVVNPSSSTIRCVDLEEGAMSIRFDGGSSLTISPQNAIDSDDMLKMLSQLRDACEYLIREHSESTVNPSALFVGKRAPELSPF